MADEPELESEVRPSGPPVNPFPSDPPQPCAPAPGPKPVDEPQPEDL